MGLNGPGALDEAISVPINKVEAAQRRGRKTTQLTKTKKSKRFFSATILAIFKQNRKMKQDKWQQTRKHFGPNSENACSERRCHTCCKRHKTENR